MPLTTADFEIQKLDQLSSENVLQILERLTAQLSEQNPTLDLRRGVFHDQLLYHRALLETALRTTLERYQSARSLLQIEQDPTLADPGVVDSVLSNWGVRRRIGTIATGSVTIELKNPRTIVIPAGFVFEANGQRYAAQTTFTSRALVEQVIGPSDRLLVPLNNGNYAFTIEVDAAEIGSQYVLNAGDLIVPNRTLVDYVTSYATSTFSGGTNTETNTELLRRLQQGVAAKTLSNRVTMQAFVNEQDRYGSVTNQSIVGYGDPEMHRDKHSVMPIAFGGRVDWYIRTQKPVFRVGISVEATCLSVENSHSVWQFSMPRNEFSGFYEIQRIRRSQDADNPTGFTIVMDDRGFDLGGSDYVPDIESVVESAYTSFQTATIRFEDTVTPLGTLAVGSKAPYTIDVVGMPLISEIQAEIGSREYRHCAADLLIRAPIPCFTSVSMQINKSASDETPDVEVIRTAVVELINSVDFIGRLDGSRILEVVHGFLRNSSSVTNLELLGRIRCPDGSTRYVRSSDYLLVPYLPHLSVSDKTVQFFAEASDIAISVSTNLPTPA